MVRTNVTPPQIKALLPRAPLGASTILSDTTLELTCDAYTKAEADGRYLSSSNFAPLDARYFARNPAVAEGNGLFHLVQEQLQSQAGRIALERLFSETFPLHTQFVEKPQPLRKWELGQWHDVVAYFLWARDVRQCLLAGIVPPEQRTFVRMQLQRGSANSTAPWTCETCSA